MSERQTEERKAKQAKGRTVRQQERKLRWRIPGWLFGLFMALEATVWGVSFTGDLALATGLSGTPGTFKVAQCYDTDTSHRRSHYVCTGTFTPHDDPGDVSHQQWEDASADYPDGAEIAMRRGADAETYQPTGFWPVLSAVWKVGLCLSVLAFCVFLPVSRKDDGRKGPGASWLGRVTNGLALVSFAGVAIAVLDGVVALVAGIVEGFAA
ncbi:hypothetical protein ACGFWI_12205 [Streptomyces sp. NPDC048434]|uniref:hypothetical protein n=1 Tax=Streptomyces sp. NPDC048434 TaxID=3365549 RepID=UPI00371BC719